MVRLLRLSSRICLLILVAGLFSGCGSDGGGETPTVSDSSGLPTSPVSRGAPGGGESAGATAAEPATAN